MNKLIYFGACFALTVSNVCWAQTDDPNSAAAQFRKLHWIHGPQSVDVGSYGKLNLPKGYMYLGPADAMKFDELTKNIPEPNENILLPEHGSWFTVFTFSDIGYVKDNEKLDADKILSDVKENTAAANKERTDRGWPTLTITGWQYKPRYDQTYKRLEWAIDARDSTGQIVTNYNTRILGRKGVVSVVLVGEPDQLESEVSDLKGILPGFNFDPGQTYSDYREGDKIAEYGLAGLITGGAVAVAAKTGLLAKFFKFIWIAIVAGLAAIKKFFGRAKNMIKSDKKP